MAVTLEDLDNDDSYAALSKRLINSDFNLLVDITKKILDKDEFERYCHLIFNMSSEEYYKQRQDDEDYKKTEEYYDVLYQYFYGDFEKVTDAQKKYLQQIKHKINKKPIEFE